jgi:two-component system phosphate regulon sensor histidine kinase PhoR
VREARSNNDLAPLQAWQFQRFYRVDKSRSRTHGGSGIRLTIAKHLVETQSGKIWVESEGENKGSDFIFTLPLG